MAEIRIPETFADKVRAVVWAVVLLALTAFALYGLAANWPWYRVAPPAIVALTMAFIAPGRTVKQ